MLPIEYDLPDAYKGDTYRRIAMTVTADGQPSDLSGGVAKMALKKGNKQVLVLSSEDGQLNVQPSGQMGVVEVPKQIIDVPAGRYLYDIQVTFPDGSRQTYVRGTLTVISDVTR